MGKKILFALVLASLLAGGISAQEKRRQFDLKAGPTPQKNAVFVDFGTTLSFLFSSGFGLGGGYERSFGSSFSGLINAYWGTVSPKNNPWGYKYTELGGDINARWYPFGTALDKLFINAGFGFSYRGYKFDSSSDDPVSYSALLIPLYAGWKFILGKHFLLEPGIGYTVGIRLSKPEGWHTFLDYNPGGMKFGVKLGWAF